MSCWFDAMGPWVCQFFQINFKMFCLYFFFPEAHGESGPFKHCSLVYILVKGIVVNPYSWFALPPSHPLFPSAIETVKRERCSQLHGVRRVPWLGTAILRMPETHNDDIWSSPLYLVSTSRTEIITVPADPVPTLESGRMEETFLGTAQYQTLTNLCHHGPLTFIPTLRVALAKALKVQAPAPQLGGPLFLGPTRSTRAG